jgi:hypothetical protein
MEENFLLIYKIQQACPYQHADQTHDTNRHIINLCQQGNHFLKSARIEKRDYALYNQHKTQCYPEFMPHMQVSPKKETGVITPVQLILSGFLIASQLQRAIFYSCSDS